MDFREDGKKKMKEKRGGKEISLSVWLDGFVEGKLVGPRCFLPEPTKMFSPQIGEKTGVIMQAMLQPMNFTFLPLLTTSN